MRKKLMMVLMGLAALTLCVGTTPAQAQSKRFLAFGGGPTGGTFNYFANGIAIYLSRALPNVEISSEGSGGSGENLRRVHAGQVDFGIVYSGDAYLGRQGMLPNDEMKYVNARTMGYLYGAPAQLVVRADAGITSAKDLAGKRVAVGNAGSGAALAAERFFRHMGLWDAVNPQFLGYSPAASAFKDRKIDAFWVLVGYPNASIIEAATQDNIALVNVHKDAEESGFYEEYPFYSMVEIPADTYRGQTETVTSFQDSTFWMASNKVDDEIVYESLKIIYSPEGLQHMVTAHSAAREMTVANGLTGASVPLHPGAVKFWSEQGLTIPDALKP